MFKSKQRWCSFNKHRFPGFHTSILYSIHLKINAICFISKDNIIHLKENVNLMSWRQGGFQCLNEHSNDSIKA